MNIENPKQLKETYPYMFAGRNIGFSFHPGWFNAFVELCQKIDKLLDKTESTFYWVQLKEKFGTARCYYDFKGADDLGDSLRNLINAYENSTNKICLACGAEASLVSDGWMTTLCPDHAEQREDETLEIVWFSAEEIS